MQSEGRWNNPDGIQDMCITATGYLNDFGSLYWAVHGSRGQTLDAFDYWMAIPSLTAAPAQADSDDAMREASSLAMSMWRHHYKDVSPNFELCDSVAGIITQIDNMAAGLAEKIVERDAEIARLNSEIRRLDFVREHTGNRYKALDEHHTEQLGQILELKRAVEQRDAEIARLNAVRDQQHKATVRLMGRLKELNTEVARLKSDAERYQQLRDIIDDGSESADHADAVVFFQTAKEDQAEIAGLRADAERYYWLRDECKEADIIAGLDWIASGHKNLDAAIDAARLRGGDV
jgi:hydrogenase maturation factor